MSTSRLPINPNPNPGNGETRVNIYGYTPWRSLGIVACLVFGITLLLHIGFAIWNRIHGRKVNSVEKDDERLARRASFITTFETLFCFGCALEVVGYAFRTASSTNPFILSHFILNYFMIVVAPVFFSASQYYSFSILLRKRESYAKLVPISGKAIVAIFVAADVITIVVQIVGAALIGVSESKLADGMEPPLTPSQANDILRAGLAVQVFSMTDFLALLAILLARLVNGRGRPVEGDANAQYRSKGTHAPFMLSLLTLSTIFIYIRTIFRLVEAAGGVTSAAGTNQALFASLETAPVFVAVILWTIFPLHCLI